MNYGHNVLALTLITSSSATANRPRCRVGQFWPKVEYDILRTVFNYCDARGVQSYQIQWNKAK